MIESVPQRIAHLRGEIGRHNYQYHILDDPLITDAEFDAMFRELQTLEMQCLAEPIIRSACANKAAFQRRVLRT